MTTPDDTATINNIVLMGDPRVTAIPVSDNGEGLTDVRDHGLRVSSFRADDAGDFAHVRAGLVTRLLQADEALRRGRVHRAGAAGRSAPAERRAADQRGPGTGRHGDHR